MQNQDATPWIPQNPFMSDPAIMCHPRGKSQSHYISTKPSITPFSLSYLLSNHTYYSSNCISKIIPGISLSPSLLPFSSLESSSIPFSIKHQPPIARSSHLTKMGFTMGPVRQRTVGKTSLACGQCRLDPDMAYTPPNPARGDLAS